MPKIILQRKRTGQVLKTCDLSFIPPLKTTVTLEDGSYEVTGYSLTFVPAKEAKEELLLRRDADETGFGEPPVVVLLSKYESSEWNPDSAP